MTILFYLLVISFLILFPDDTAQNALHALQLWGGNIVPILFPYMIFSRLLCIRLHALHFPASPAAAVLGLLGGSPSGASMIALQAGTLRQSSLSALCALTGTISPMFILGTIHTWTQDSSLCRRLLQCHWLSAGISSWIVWRFLSLSWKKQEIPFSVNTGKKADPIVQSIDAILHVGGCIILYSVLSGILGKLLLALFPSFMPVIYALLEISGGIHSIVQCGYSFELKGVLISAALGFSGFSILSQNHTVLCSLGIRMRELVLFGIIRAVVSASLFALLLRLFPIS